jgi:hypothetical protein
MLKYGVVFEPKKFSLRNRLKEEIKTKGPSTRI